MPDVTIKFTPDLSAVREQIAPAPGVIDPATWNREHAGSRLLLDGEDVTRDCLRWHPAEGWADLLVRDEKGRVRFDPPRPEFVEYDKLGNEVKVSPGRLVTDRRYGHFQVA
jgi:hypothetical protein